MGGAIRFEGISRQLGGREILKDVTSAAKQEDIFETFGEGIIAMYPTVLRRICLWQSKDY